MSLIRWSPFFEPMEELEKRFFSDLPVLRGADRGFVPAVDVYETKDAVMVDSSLAGVDPDDVSVTVENNILTIKGETEKKSEVEEKDYYRKEVRYGSFYRQVALPAPVDGDKAEATFEKGLLKIRIPKRAEAAAKTIKVNVKK
ncbi:Hsp20/alpha crystallin family protein [Patescibacteria group bacterium]|nr:MAG: Hsp20/alpha crystallin family protein [Patescibacteria group bacterium]